MSIYVLPQTQAFADFSGVAPLVARPLRAHVAGGHAQLVRFNTAAEQASGFLAYYDNLLDHTYPWPGRQTPSTLDPAYTKLWAKNALLQYFGTTVGGGYAVQRLAGYNNRIRSSVLSFAANGTANPRSAVFLDRDVRPGDIVKVRGLGGDAAQHTLWTSVKSVQGDVVPAVVGAATGDANNAATQVATSSAVKTHGEDNGVVVTPDGTLYSGLASGFVSETYDVLVTQASVGEDYTKAVLKVISGSGGDDQAAVVPAAKGVAFAVGTRGLKITLSTDHLSSSSASAATAHDPYGALVVGHKWRVTVSQAFTAPVPTSGGGYAGSAATTYIVKVSLGGKYTDAVQPQVSVTTTNGVDISGPTTVTAANTAVPVGTQGATIKFSQTALRTGDVYYVPCTPATVGVMHTLELNANLDSTIASGAELDLTLFINQPQIQISANRTNFAPAINWSQDDAGGVTVKAGIVAYDPTWTNAGVPVALPLASDGVGYSGIYVEYRCWLQDLTGDVFGISSASSLDAAISGANHPDNPLKYAVGLALGQSNGSEVKYSGVNDPADLTQWTNLLGYLAERDDVYGLVPLTKDPNVLALYAAHVQARSTPELKTWRVAWFNLTGVPLLPVVTAGSTVINHTAATTSDGQVCLCVIEDDPQVAGTQNTILRCTSGNGKFLTNGVKAGDIVRTQYTGDGFGNYTWTEYVVASVDSEDQLHLLVGSAVPVNQGSKTEIWRNTSADVEAAEIAKQSAAWNADDPSRIRAVWPDQAEVAGVAVDGTFLCAALAGLASGILPQQSMTKLQVTGFSSVRRSVPKFTSTQLDVLTQGGVWVVTQDRASGNLYTRQAVTAAPYANLDQREEMVVRNVDSVHFRFKEWLDPFIGAANVTPLIVTRIGTEVKNLKGLLQTEAATDLLGGQLLDAQIVTLAQHATLLDHIVLDVKLTVPVAVNAIDLTITL